MGFGMTRRALFGSFLFATLATLATSGAARADDTSTPAPGYHVERVPSTGGMIGGALLFGLTYAPSVALGSVIVANGAPAGAWLFVPVVGPLIELGGLGGGGVLSGLLGVAAVTDGLAQLGGLTWFMVSALVKHDRVVRDTASLQVAPAPLVARGTLGFGVVGRF